MHRSGIGRRRVYVAGPITVGDPEQNVRRACAAGRELILRGFAPMVPHLTCYFGGPAADITGGGIDYEAWMAIDFAWIAVADALLRIPGESKGADREVVFAGQRSIPVYYSVDDLMAGFPKTAANSDSEVPCTATR